MKSPQKRFSDRVEFYLKFRPRYPHFVLDILRNSYQLQTSSTIADIGSGTGFLCQLFLENGNHVWGVEPNQEMRLAGEQLLKKFNRFRSVAGCAEETCLPDHSMDFITAGQAFHWFDPELCRIEFLRVLKPDGIVVLVWNERRTDKPFLAHYEEFLQQYAIDYSATGHRRLSKVELENFFGGSIALYQCDNNQKLDFEGLHGRTLSASYMPKPGDSGYAGMTARLQDLYDEFSDEGTVEIGYDTKIYAGRIVLPQ